MADYILGENQLKLVVELLKEQDVSEKIDYCKDTFGTRTPEYRFCTKAASYIKSQKSYQSDFRKYLETYVDNIVMDRILNELIRKLIDDDHVYYKRPDGEYSVFNRIDTNYSALAVTLTYYYSSKGAFELLMSDMGNKLNKVDWNSLTVSWIDHFFNPELEPYDPRSEMFRSSGSIFDIDSSPSYVLFTKMFNPKNIKVDSKKIFDSILKVLKDVRERGFATEDLFQEKLDEYNIPYKRYARDYGFVDRFLGVDFVVQKGNEWLPVQVKSSKNEPQYRIEELDCDEPIIAIKDGNDFRLNNSRGFERYFCDFLKVCRKV